MGEKRKAVARMCRMMRSSNSKVSKGIRKLKARAANKKVYKIFIYRPVRKTGSKGRSRTVSRYQILVRKNALRAPVSRVIP
jgi:hypothetical protein